MALNEWPLDAASVIQSVYDTNQNALRVNTQATVTAGALEVAIDATTDSIKIGDGTDFLAINPDGSINVVAALNQGTDSILIYGWDGTNNQKVKVDSSGELQIDVLSSALPLGASTSALQISGNSSLSSIDSKLPSGLTITSSRLLVDGSGVTQPISGSVSVSNFPSTFGVTQSTSPWIISATDLDVRDLVFATDKVDVSGSSISVSNFPASQSVTQGTSPWVVSGTVTANHGGTWSVTANAGTNLNTSALALDATLTNRTQLTKLTDGTRDGTIKAASTASVAADTSLVVALSPNSPIPTGSNIIGSLTANQSVNVSQMNGVNVSMGAGTTGTGVQRVVLPTDQSSIPVNATLNATHMSSFGDLQVAELEPEIQLDFVYGTSTQTGTITTANSATVDTNSGRLRLQSGTNTAGSAIFNSRRSIRYRQGEGTIARFTAAFVTNSASSTQIVGAGNSTDGYFFGYNGTAFGILHMNNGSDTWTAQTAWNGDKCDGTGASGFNINPTLGNVFQIKYPFLGYGAITFWILSSAGSWILAHTIQYPNTSATIQLSNPALFFYAQAINSGSATNKTIYVGSAGMFISGKKSFIGNAKWGRDSTKTSISTETNIITLKNATTYNGITNRGMLRIHTLSVGATTTNATSAVRFKINATLGGSPSYTTVSGTTADNGTTITNGESPASFDTAGTTVTGGTQIFTMTLGGASGANDIDLTGHNIIVAPGETLTISAASSANNNFIIGINWFDDI